MNLMKMDRLQIRKSLLKEAFESISMPVYKNEGI